jgi:hypothetical protein
MLNINLPVINENKIVKKKFKLIIEEKKIIIESEQKNNILWVPVFSKNYGFTKSLVKFPLQIDIYNNQYLLFINLIEVSFYQDTYNNFNNYDFYSCLLKKLKNVYKIINPDINLKYFKSNNLLSYPKVLFNKLISSLKIKIDVNNDDILLEDVFEYVYNYYTNLKSLFLILCYQYTLNPSSETTFMNFIKKKKISNLSKNILRLYFFEIKFNSEENISILNILENKNKNLEITHIYENKSFYIKKKIENKSNNFFLVSVLNKNNFKITLTNDQIINFKDYEWFNSVPTVKFDINNIFFKIIKSLFNIKLLKNNSFYDIFNMDGLERFIPVIFGEEKIYPTIKILKKFNITKIKSKLKGIINLGQIDNNEQLSGFDIYRNIDQIELSYLSNKILINKDLNEVIFYFEEYFKKILYPIKYNRRSLDHNFDKLLYLTLKCREIMFVESGSKVYLNNQITQLIPIKMKNFFTNISKYLYLLIKNGNCDNFIYNYKFYQDTIYQTTLRVILTSEDCLSHQILKELLGNRVYLIDKILCLWRKSYFLRNIASVLEWNNIKNYLEYLKYLLDNNDLIFFNNKLNKSIFPSDIDDNLRKIIMCPFKMFQYLSKKIDFVKWAQFLGKKYVVLYSNPISLSSEDIVLLGELIFYLYDVETQVYNNTKYQTLLNFAKKNHKLIVKNGRINLRIKDKLGKMKCNYNLGFLAKHITYNDNSDSISLSETSKEKVIVNSELIDLRYKLTTITKKYYKYKAKYLKNKDRLGLLTTIPTSNFSVI